MPISFHSCRRVLSTLLLTLAAILGLSGIAHAAGVIYHFSTPTAQPGATVTLQGLAYNDSGNALPVSIVHELSGYWSDAQGATTPARFHLVTSPEAADLPANTFTQMAWTARIPAHANGILNLHLEDGSGTLLALQVGNAAQVAATAGTQRGSAALAGTPAETAATPSTTITSSGTPPSLIAAGEVPGEAPPEGSPAGVQAVTTNGLSPFDTFRNAISPYDPIYFVAGRTGGATGRFQLSFKYRLFSPQNPQKPHFMDNWYLGYTQTSLWDLHSDSIPFIDTTYNPSLFWARDSLFQTADKRWFAGLNAGAEHKSNGKGGADSRSLNDFYLQPEFNYRTSGGGTLSFMPRFKYYVDYDRSMGYPDSLGRIDWKLRWAQDDGLTLSGLYRQGAGSRNATQLEAAWPLKRTPLHMNGYLYVQYFRGYGETLLDYNQKHEPQLRVGIALVP